MESFTRQRLVTDRNSKDLQFQIIEWWAQDEEPDVESESEGEESDKSEVNTKYTIHCFGATKEGQTVACRITGFHPYYYIKVEKNFDRLKLQRFISFVKESYALSRYKDPILKESGLVEKKDLFGFRNGKRYKYVKLIFNNYTAMMRSRYLFKKPIHIPGVTSAPVKFKLYESNFEPFMRYCHIKDILMAGWITLPAGKYQLTSDVSNAQIATTIDKRDVVSSRDKQDMARFLQASWDIEVYSHDYTFPDPKRKENEIFQIATTYKYYGDKDPIVKHLLTLKKCAKISDPSVIVEECSSEKDLIKKWADTISEMDPDIFYTYNGDSFDCLYLVERGIRYGLVSPDKKSGYLLSQLSRLNDTPAYIKPEFFSSSAYGDNEYHRMYIPGRLNYDLLIHYKRGMKKYSSYKLDYIATQILGEGKHDVSAKDIFKAYEHGTPKQIQMIGEYCLQDTELLQKLVDKQLVLTNIVQLANVTYVPIGFLTTRGQTIKVYSQLLRKARQMDFLVPHTNFNEDQYPCEIKTKNPHPFQDKDIGEYVEVTLASITVKGVIANVEESRIVVEGEGNNFEPCHKYKKVLVNDKDIHAKINKIDGKKIVVDFESGPVVFEKGKHITLKINTSKLNGKLSQITDDYNVIVQSDTELSSMLFNRTMTYKRRTYSCNVSPVEDATDDSFTGATVLEAQSGMYTDNIAVLDFASLYPTVMISRNLCYSTFVLDERYLNIQGVSYETIAWDDKVEYKLKQTCEGVGKSGKSKGLVCGKQAYFQVDGKYFCRIHDPMKKERNSDEKYQKRHVSYDFTIVQPHIDQETGERVNLGVLPALLEELYSERKKVKAQMAKAQMEGNKLLADILDSTQLAIKVSLNSTYGFLGRCQGNLILKELGSIVTSVGRMLIEQSKEYAEDEFLQWVRDNSLVTHEVKYLGDKVGKLNASQKKGILAQYSQRQ